MSGLRRVFIIIRLIEVEKMKKIFLLLAFPALVIASQPESYYQEKHCKGESEYVLHDRTRVDCLTATHAIEYDFSHKWAEAIGQSLGYAFETNKKAGIVLIIKNKNLRHWHKLNSIVDHYKLPIDLWKIDVE